MQKREEKWHRELDTVYSLDFWQGARKLYSDNYLENKLKWLQYQIVRNSLQTNLIVSHFKASVSSLCSYCLEADEQVSHLFWSCKVVRPFLDQIIVFLNTCNIQLTQLKRIYFLGIITYHFQTQKTSFCYYLNVLCG